MAEINYETLVGGLVKPLVTRPSEVIVSTEAVSEKEIAVTVKVHPNDLGRVIGKHGRVASAIRTLTHAAATRNEQLVTVEFTSIE
ncbi:MAG: KH domain-containing protein [Bacilli bacterium]|nr:KH domain-containing protein [Mollicutes bacterium]MDY3899118.1 KH domain-containing protein [Bacilli bacterium]